MSADKTTPKIGTVLEAEEQRDAIHIAVAPVIAAEKLSPGDHVGLLPDGRASEHPEHIGIVDPYLKKTVREGQRFYLFLYPQTITSLRHEWTHPAFGAKQESAVAESERWLRDYVVRNCPYDENQPDKGYAEFLQRLRAGEVFYNGSDLHSFSELEEPQELRYHAERVLGVKLYDWSQFSFSCSC